MDTFDRIEMLLKENRMTQADLARATGISTGLISQWKKRMQNPSAEKLKLVADVFEVTVDYLMNGENEKKQPFPVGAGEGGRPSTTRATVHRIAPILYHEKPGDCNRVFLRLFKEVQSCREKKSNRTEKTDFMK